MNLSNASAIYKIERSRLLIFLFPVCSYAIINNYRNIRGTVPYRVCVCVCIDSVPWGSVNPRWIKQAVDAGQALSADPAVPQPYYDLLLSGLKPRAQERTCSLQDLRYTLRSALRVTSAHNITLVTWLHTPRGL